MGSIGELKGGGGDTPSDAGIGVRSIGEPRGSGDDPPSGGPIGTLPSISTMSCSGIWSASCCTSIWLPSLNFSYHPRSIASGSSIP